MFCRMSQIHREQPIGTEQPRRNPWENYYRLKLQMEMMRIKNEEIWDVTVS